MKRYCIIIFLSIIIMCSSIINYNNIARIHKLEQHIENQDSTIKVLHELLIYD